MNFQIYDMNLTKFRILESKFAEDKVTFKEEEYDSDQEVSEEYWGNNSNNVFSINSII